ncbi:glycosyltransferase [Leucothrix sargassi]|nr:glycosyltransferase [Leucothrix sargassi]
MTYEYDLSVILPVYNVEKYISQCLDGLLSQSFQGRLQIVLVEDKSPDDSLKVCRHYADKYSEVFLIEHQSNGGSAVARNTGLEFATGEYYVFVDPDDLVPEQAFDILYKAITESGADIVKGSNTAFREVEDAKLAPYSVDVVEEYSNSDCLTVLLRHEKLRGHPWGKIFRASSFPTERFTPGYNMAQDLLYCAELFSKAQQVKLIPDVVYCYRLHSGGATGRKYETGAYLSWLNCICELKKFVTTESQRVAYLELKVRTLTQVAREARQLRGDRLTLVLGEIKEREKEWLPSLRTMVFQSGLPLRAWFRYFKFLSTVHKLS